MRIYRVRFELYSSRDGWMRNSFTLDVAVRGGADAALKAATRRARRGDHHRFRAEEITLLASED